MRAIRFYKFIGLNITAIFLYSRYPAAVTKIRPRNGQIFLFFNLRPETIIFCCDLIDKMIGNDYIAII